MERVLTHRLRDMLYAEIYTSLGIRPLLILNRMGVNSGDISERTLVNQIVMAMKES